ncbi:hypothetical protein KCP71_14740 [Salmonella enterica subsp. enterica]|nr:hypothetical protein KCP71_14740 [Salmonella enterica subsp. enterica]
MDDSIVRGTTSEQIVEMARKPAREGYLASAAPEIRFPASMALICRPPMS